ncbi:MAG: HEAT repeat domain-containing protein [Gloeomargarita sp. HHBFW_bins_162]
MDASQFFTLKQRLKMAASPTDLVQVVQELAVHSDHNEAIPLLIEVLGYNNPQAAQVAIGGLLQAGRRVVPELLQRLDGYNYGARAYAIRVLAQIGDPQALDVLQEAARSDFAPSVRRAALRGLGTIQWQDLAEPELAQTQVIQTLQEVSRDGDWGIRYAVVVAVELWRQRGVPDFLAPQIEALLHQLTQDDDPVVQARAQYSLHQSDKYVTMPNGA